MCLHCVGMLTELGSSQLATIGRNFHQRYYDLLNISNPSRQIYSRSTNMCRTLLSLRSFLSGFLLSNSEFMTELSLLPKLVSRCKTEETLYPQAGKSALDTSTVIWLLDDIVGDYNDFSRYRVDLYTVILHLN